MRKIEHIGIAVRDLDKSNELFSKLLGFQPYKIEEVTDESVKTSFFRLGANKIELIQDMNSDGTITRFIKNKGEGVHHIAIDVDDIYIEIERLEAEGFQIINRKPHEGADNKLVCFIHPKSANGLLIELCQENKK